MSRIIRGALLAAIVLSAPTLCEAAASDLAPDGPTRRTVPESTEPGKSGSSSGPLSDKLDSTGGVIHPPAAVDPGINRSPPSAGPGSMPVIPPPGTPGSGSPEVEPK